MTAKDFEQHPQEEEMLKGYRKPTRLDFSIDLADNTKREGGIRHVVRQLCHWEDLLDESITITTLQGGLTNQLYLVRERDGERAALVRIYGKNTEVIIDRAEESVVFHILSEESFGPKLFGLFRNGRVEGYFPSVALQPPQMGEKETFDYPGLIAAELAKMHQLSMPLSKSPFLWEFIHKFAGMTKGMSFPDHPQDQERLDELKLEQVWNRIEELEDELPSKRNKHGQSLIDQVESEVERVVMEFLFEPVFCHNDLLAGNVLFVESEKRVQLIDFEYGKYNYRGFDFGNHFCEYAGFDFDLDRWYPEPRSQRYFLENYVRHAAGLSDSKYASLKEKLESDEAFADEFFNICNKWVDKFALSANLMWGLWSLIQKMYSPIDFDYLDYARLRLSAISWCPENKSQESAESFESAEGNGLGESL